MVIQRAFCRFNKGLKFVNPTPEIIQRLMRSPSGQVAAWERFDQSQYFLEKALYPVTKTQLMQKRGVQKCMIPHGCLDVSYRSWHKSKNPCLCGNHTFPYLEHHQNLEALGLWPHAPQALMIHLIGKCWISTWTWALAIIATCRTFPKYHQSFRQVACLHQPEIIY